MRPYLHSLLISLLFPFLVYAQSNLISYHSNFEDSVFTHINEVDHLSLFLAIEPSMDQDKYEAIKSEIKQFESTILSKKYAEKKAKKAVKMLYQEAQSNFLGSYKEVAHLSEIFDKREFNCVSGTALFCIIMEDLNTPYLIKKQPNHVYCVAYPKVESILIESTLPVDGLFQVDDKYALSVIQNLLSLNQISLEEVETQGYREFFNNLYVNKDEITIRELASFQYHNLGLKYLAKNNFKKACSAFSKAYTIYPEHLYQLMVDALMFEMLKEKKFNNDEDFQFLVDYYKVRPEDFEIVNEIYFNHIRDRMLNFGQEEFCKRTYALMSSQLQNDTILPFITQNYHNVFAAYYYNTGNYSNGINEAKKSLALNPHNNYTQAIIIDCIVGQNSNALASKNLTPKLVKLMKELPYLKEHSAFQSFYFSNLTIVAANNFKFGQNINLAVRNLEKVEKMYDKYGDDLNINPDILPALYFEAGFYHYRKREYRRAEYILKRGLKIFPDNEDLLSRLAFVQEKWK